MASTRYSARCRARAHRPDLPRPLRRDARAAGRRPPRHPLGRGQRRRRYRHRPHRPGRRRRGLRAIQGIRPRRHRAAGGRRHLHRRRRLRLPRRPVGQGGAGGGLRQPQGEGRPLPRARLHPPLPSLLALRQRARLPPGRRVVHLHGRAEGRYPGPRGARKPRRSHRPAQQDRRSDEKGALDPRVRRGARDRLAAQHARLDDLEEALLRPRPADLRVPRLRQLRGHRLRDRAAGARRSRAGASSRATAPTAPTSTR